ncbi:hypothetical protein GCM10027059_48300 [Myceligenerans halotolerans]
MRIAEPLPLLVRRRRGYLIPTPSFDSRPLDETEKDQAVCLSDPDLWFSDHPGEQAEAKRRCHTCPLIDRCLAIALDHHRPTVQGIWAGTTEKDRAAIRPAWRRAREAAAKAKADAARERETDTTTSGAAASGDQAAA